MTHSIKIKTETLIKETLALMLWQFEAIQISPEKPFRLTSGNYSPIYINCRRLISEPTFIQYFCGAAKYFISHRKIKMDVIAGGETAGIPFAAFLSQSLSLPLVYIRKKTKAHGIAKLVEGNLPKGKRVLLVEDLITDAGSKIHFAESIRANGAYIEDVLVVFDRNQGGAEVLQRSGMSLHSLTDLDVALNVAQNNNIVTNNTITLVKKYLDSPIEWHTEMGLEYQSI